MGVYVGSVVLLAAHTAVASAVRPSRIAERGASGVRACVRNRAVYEGRGGRARVLQ